MKTKVTYKTKNKASFRYLCSTTKRQPVLRRKKAVTQEFSHLVKLPFMCENVRKILTFARI